MNLSTDEKLAELIGIMLGDGCLCRTARQRLIYICGHKTDDCEYHTTITAKLFKDIFNKEIKIHFRNNVNVVYIKFSDKEIFRTLRSLQIPVGKKYNYLRIPVCINSDKLFCSLMRGLFDTDGCVVLSRQHRENPYYPRLEI
ncbi:hypothetical protein GOV09_06485, partial [Candidatus Woesearchaeota archaeon]|nr:hypothetical protein [Candidatus Woesearchaeota archaeon]